VIARFRLWRRAFRDHDTILHLDADTLVLAPLDPLFERPEPFIVANHEPSPEIRIFRPEHRRTAELQARLRQDGITYPGHPDDMGNAGVFTLPRAFRSREHLATLASFAQRYGAYLAYADQSLVSLWLRSLGIRPTSEFAYNFQTPFFTASDVAVPREDIRILHFSSDRKPGTRAFEQWNRVGEAREWLVDLFEEYKSF
jgi:lipopolysaccharide biosynthesis glycosyltransferase